MEWGTFLGLKFLHTFMDDCNKYFYVCTECVPVPLVVWKICSFISAVFKAGPPGPCRWGLHSQKTFPIAGFWQTAVCLLGRLETCALSAGVGGDHSGPWGAWVVLSAFSSLSGHSVWPWSGLVPSLCHWLWICDWGCNGKPSCVRNLAGAGWPSPSWDNLSPWQQAEAPRDSDRLWNPGVGLSRIT